MKGALGLWRPKGSTHSVSMTNTRRGKFTASRSMAIKKIKILLSVLFAVFADGRESDIIAFQLPSMSRCTDKHVSANLKSLFLITNQLSVPDSVMYPRVSPNRLPNRLSLHNLAGTERQSICRASQREHIPRSCSRWLLGCRKRLRSEGVGRARS